MKRVFTLLGIVVVAAVVLAACNTNPKSASENMLKYEDTVGLAQFQAWKAQNERVDPVYAVAAAPARKASSSATKTRRASTQTKSMTSTSTNQAKAKKGWSKSAKYAVIGGAAGGIAGAVINKRNRPVGAVIGAVIGAGGGYVLGRSADKKDGRF